jgi:hypothetical protein
VLWAVTSALALATHYFAIFLVGPEAAWLLLRAPSRRSAKALVGGVAVVFAALLPLLLDQKSQGLSAFIQQQSLAARAIRVPKNFVVGYDAPLETILAVVGVGIGLAGVVVAARRGLAPGVRIAAALAAAGIGLPFLLALVGQDYLLERNVIAALLPVTIVVGAGLATSRLGLLGAAVLCGIGFAAVIGVAVTPLWQHNDWRGAAAALGPPRSARAIVVNPATGSVPFRHYLPGTVPMSESGARVRDVALVAGPDHRSPGDHPGPPPRPEHPVVSGFVETHRQYTDGYSIVEFQSSRPERLTRGALLGFALRKSDLAKVLLQVDKRSGRPE